MKKLHKAFFPLVLILAMSLFYVNNALADDYDSQVAALQMKQAQLEEELAKASPNPGRIQSLSREIGELNGQILAAGAANGRYQAPPDQGYTAYPDYPQPRNYYRGYGHRGYGHRGWGHAGGWNCGCW